MENLDSILDHTQIDSAGQQQLKTTGSWARMIGVVYIVLACLIVLVAILALSNLDFIADQIIRFNGLSESTLDFMLGAGKWLFALMMTISSFILFLNGFFLIKFGFSCKHYFNIQQDKEFENSLTYLSRYFMLTTVLSIVSTLFTLAFIVFYLFK